jgi:hypothetical protein
MSDMTFWLDLSAPLRAPAGVDPFLYEQMIAVSNKVADRVTRCFAGPAWLKRRFHARSYVRLHLLLTDDASVSVEHLKTKSWIPGGGGPLEIRCGLRIPTAWLAERGDGLLGLRLFQAVLHALHAVGDHHDIGGAPAPVGPGADRSTPEVWDPFHPPPPPPTYADINTHLERLTATLHPDQLLLAAKEPMSSTVAKQCQDACEALGAVIDQQTLTAPDAKATAWIIQTRS